MHGIVTNYPSPSLATNLARCGLSRIRHIKYAPVLVACIVAEANDPVGWQSAAACRTRAKKTRSHGRARGAN